VLPDETDSCFVLGNAIKIKKLGINMAAEKM
jgi:hypothetical protein